MFAARMALGDQDRRRMGKALWAWSGLDQREFAEKSGVTYDRLRGAFNDATKTPPSTDELCAMAAVADVPEHVVLEGWGQPMHERAAELEQLTEVLEGAVGKLTGELARHDKDIRELLDWRRRLERGEGTG